MRIGSSLKRNSSQNNVFKSLKQLHSMCEGRRDYIFTSILKLSILIYKCSQNLKMFHHFEVTVICHLYYINNFLTDFLALVFTILYLQSRIHRTDSSCHYSSPLIYTCQYLQVTFRIKLKHLLVIVELCLIQPLAAMLSSPPPAFFLFTLLQPDTPLLFCEHAKLRSGEVWTCSPLPEVSCSQVISLLPPTVLDFHISCSVQLACYLLKKQSMTTLHS